MNTLENRMVEILKELKEKYGAMGVKAEFEAEGTRLEELLRLKELCMTAGMRLILKIGGCESVRDVLESRIVGVDSLVAPMVESAYAMKKYLQTVVKIFPPDEIKNIEILCNIETAEAVKNTDEMLRLPEISALNGIVIERVDLCFSLGMDEEQIHSEKVSRLVENTLKKAKNNRLLAVIGGGVSAASLPFFRTLAPEFLDRYETRKICFDSRTGLNNSPEKGILKALAFELLWLRNKINYYNGVAAADRQRMEVIERNYEKQIRTLI